MARDKACLTLKSDGVRDQTPTGGKPSPACVEEVIVADTSSDEDRVWRALVCKRCRRSALYDLQVWYTKLRSISQDSGCAVFFCFEGDTAARGVKAHPLNPNRSATGAYVPKGLVWQRSEAGQRYCTNLTLGQLPICIKNVVGQTRCDG